jgi:hypothetical protein
MSREPRSRGAIMRRMASIHAELDSIAHSDRPLEERANLSKPLRRELAELNQKLWGDQIRRRD